MQQAHYAIFAYECMKSVLRGSAESRASIRVGYEYIRVLFYHKASPSCETHNLKIEHEYDLECRSEREGSFYDCPAGPATARVRITAWIRLKQCYIVACSPSIACIIVHN